MLLTHSYPNVTRGCIVNWGTLRCIEAEGRSVDDGVINEAECYGGLLYANMYKEWKAGGPKPKW